MNPMKQIEKDNRRFPDHGNPLSGPHFEQLTSFKLILKNDGDDKLSRIGMNLINKHVQEMLLSSEQCKCVPINGHKCLYNMDKENVMKDCVNFDLGYECDPACGQREGVICKNSCIAKGVWKKLILVPRYDSGAGVAAAEPIIPRELICEYIGVIYMYYQNPDYADSHYAFMLISHQDLNKAVSLEPLRKGTIGRFINHSENPNCIAKVMVVGDELRMGIYATKYISVGGDILLDYGPDFKKLLATECRCGDMECCVHAHNYWSIKTEKIREKCGNNVDTSMEVQSSNPPTSESYSQNTTSPSPGADPMHVTEGEDNALPFMNSPQQHDPNTLQQTTPPSPRSDPMHVQQEEDPCSHVPQFNNSSHSNNSPTPQPTSSSSPISDVMEGIQETDNPSTIINSPRRDHTHTPQRTTPSPLSNIMEGIEETDNLSTIINSPRHDHTQTPQRTTPSPLSNIMEGIEEADNPSPNIKSPPRAHTQTLQSTTPSPISDVMEGIQEADNPSPDINSPPRAHTQTLQTTTPSPILDVMEGTQETNNPSPNIISPPHEIAIISQQTSTPVQGNVQQQQNVSQSSQIVDIIDSPHVVSEIASPSTLLSSPVTQEDDDCPIDISLENSPPHNHTNTTCQTSSSTPSPTITPQRENIFRWDLDSIASPHHRSSPNPTANTTTPVVIPHAIPCSSNSQIPCGDQLIIPSASHATPQDGVFFFIPADLLGGNIRVTVELDSSSPDRNTIQSPRRIQGPSSTFPETSTTGSSTRRILSLVEDNPNIAISVVGKRKIFKFNPNLIKSTSAGSTKKMSTPKKKTSKPEKVRHPSGDGQSSLTKRSKTNIPTQNNTQESTSGGDNETDDGCIVVETSRATETKSKGKKPPVVRLPRKIPTSEPGTSKSSTVNKNATSQTPGASITPVSGTGSQTHDHDSEDDNNADDCMMWEPTPVVPVVPLVQLPSVATQSYVPAPSIPGPSHTCIPPTSIPVPTHAFIPPPSIPGPSRPYQQPPSVPGPSHASIPPPAVPSTSCSNTNVKRGAPKIKNKRILENLTEEEKTAVVLDIINRLDNERGQVVLANVPKGKGRPPKAPGNWNCTFCKHISTSAIDHTNHLNSHAGLRPFKCSTCPKGFTSKLCLQRHEENHKPLAERANRYRCSTCSTDFGSVAEVTTHMKKPTSTCKLQKYKHVKKDGTFTYAGNKLDPVEVIDEEELPSEDTDSDSSP